VRGTLILTVLNITGSYARDTERPADPEADVPDTLQWWIGEQAWRIRTYGMDHDIHTHAVGPGRTDLVETARANNARHYGDVTRAEHVFHFRDCTDAHEVAAAFAAAGLPPRLEVAAGRFAFWKPDDARYRSQSTPR
jgi:hypothetical protein